MWKRIALIWVCFSTLANGADKAPRYYRTTPTNGRSYVYRNGTMQGAIITQGKSTYLRDMQGRSAGYTYRSANGRTYLYDSRGRLSGTSIPRK